MSAAEGNLVSYIQPAASEEEGEREAFLRTLDEELPIEDAGDDSRVTLDLVIDRYFEMIQKWEQDANASYARENQWLHITILGFARSYDFPKGKTRKLPHGEFGKRWQGPTIEIVDMDKAVAFAEENGLEIKKTVGKTPLLKHMEATKKLPPGCAPVPGEDRIFARVTA